MTVYKQVDAIKFEKGAKSFLGQPVRKDKSDKENAIPFAILTIAGCAVKIEETDWLVDGTTVVKDADLPKQYVVMAEEVGTDEDKVIEPTQANVPTQTGKRANTNSKQNGTNGQ